MICILTRYHAKFARKEGVGCGWGGGGARVTLYFFTKEVPRLMVCEGPLERNAVTTVLVEFHATNKDAGFAVARCEHNSKVGFINLPCVLLDYAHCGLQWLRQAVLRYTANKRSTAAGVSACLSISEIGAQARDQDSSH